MTDSVQEGQVLWQPGPAELRASRLADYMAYVEQRCGRIVVGPRLVLGGHAVAFHGHPRATRDLDVLVRPDRANAAAERPHSGLHLDGPEFRSHQR